MSTSAPVRDITPTQAPVATAAPPTILTAKSGSTLATDTDWPTFAHDLSRSSTQPGTSTITASSVSSLQLLWQYKSASSYDLASPIVVNGVVYATDIMGNLAAISEATGSVIWTRSFGAEMKMTPALYDGHLFVATFINAKDTKSELYSLDPATGATQWSVPVPGGVHGSPVLIQGLLYVPLSLGDPGYCNPGGVYVFDEETGSLASRWLTGGSVIANGGAIWSPLTYDGSRILYGTGNTCLTSLATGNAVVALAPTMVQEWAYQTADPFSDDDVGGGVIESSGSAYVTGKNGYLYAFNPASGAMRWSKNLGVADLYGSYSTPVIASNTLITSVGYLANPQIAEPTGTQYGKLVGLNPATGSQAWQILATSPFYDPPSFVGSIGFTTIDASIAAIDAASGTVLWTSPLQAASRSDVAVANNEVFVSDANGVLYAFALPTTENASLRKRASAMKLLSQAPHFVNYIPRFCKLK